MYMTHEELKQSVQRIDPPKWLGIHLRRLCAPLTMEGMRGEEMNMVSVIDASSNVAEVVLFFVKVVKVKEIV